MILFLAAVVVGLSGVVLLFGKAPEQSLGFAEDIDGPQTRRERRRRADAKTRLALEVLGKSEEEFQAEQLLYTLVLGVCGALPAAGATVGAFPINPLIVVPCIPLAALSGWFLSAASVRSEAEKLHTEFLFAFGGYLTFVVMLLSGGMQQEPALKAAANLGGGRHYATIRRVLGQIESEGAPIWHMFSRLAALHPTRALDEISTSARLTQQRGASLVDALMVKSEILRDEQRLAIRRAAERASAAMQLPALVFVFGPIAFVMIGVMRQLNSSFSGFSGAGG